MICSPTAAPSGTWFEELESVPVGKEYALRHWYCNSVQYNEKQYLQELDRIGTSSQYHRLRDDTPHLRRLLYQAENSRRSCISTTLAVQTRIHISTVLRRAVQRGEKKDKRPHFWYKLYGKGFFF